MDSSTNYPGASQSDDEFWEKWENDTAFSSNRTPLGCSGLHPGMHIPPPPDGWEDDEVEEIYDEPLRIRGGGNDSLDVDHDAANVFTLDPCHPPEQKGFKLSFFSRKKPSAPKPVKPSSIPSRGIHIPFFSKRADPNPLRKRTNPDPMGASESEKNWRRTIGKENSDDELDDEWDDELFFDQQAEQKKEFVRFSNASTATLRLQSVDDMQTLNDALPTFVRLSNASTTTLRLQSVDDMQALNDALPTFRL